MWQIVLALLHHREGLLSRIEFVRLVTRIREVFSSELRVSMRYWPSFNFHL